MKTTFNRTLVQMLVILLVTLLLISASLQILVRNFMTQQSVENLKNDCATITELASAYYAQGSLSTQSFFVNLSIATQVSGADAVVCNGEGKLVLCSDSPLGCEHQGMRIEKSYLTEVFNQGEVFDVGIIDGLYTDSRYIVSMPILDSAGKAVGIVIASTPVTKALAVLDNLTDIYLLVAVIAVLAAVAFTVIVTRKQGAYLQKMVATANQFGHGQLDARVSVDENSPQDYQDLALAFNNMASSLQKSEYQRQEFVANVSHELKTPMTTISGYVDGILDGTIPPEKQHHYMQLVSQETKRLSRLVRSMLDISRMQDQEGIAPESLSRFDVCECVGQVLITFEQKITGKKLNVDVAFPEYPVYTWANQDAITQVVYNLVDNAVKFCPEEGTLTLSIRDTDSKVYVTVGNDGQTIPPEELPLVFDRFHKLDKSRSQNRDGWGLGLYIVKTLICRHGEDISVSSQNDRTEFTFTLPHGN